MDGDQSSRTEYKGWGGEGESGKLTANERGEDDWNKTEPYEGGSRKLYCSRNSPPLPPTVRFQNLNGRDVGVDLKSKI